MESSYKILGQSCDVPYLMDNTYLEPNEGVYALWKLVVKKYQHTMDHQLKRYRCLEAIFKGWTSCHSIDPNTHPKTNHHPCTE